MVLTGGFPRVLFPPCAVSPPVVFPPCGLWLGLCVSRVDPAFAMMEPSADQPSGVGTPDSGWQTPGRRGRATAALSSTTPADTTAGTPAGRQQRGSRKVAEEKILRNLVELGNK